MVEVLFCCEPEWLCMIMNIGWFWIEPWAEMAMYDIDSWLIAEWVMGRMADYEILNLSRMAEMDVDPWLGLNEYMLEIPG